MTVRRNSFQVEQRSTAPVEVLWALLDDVPGWPTWMPGVRSSAWERAETHMGAEPAGVRTMSTRGITAREQVILSEPPHRQCYTMLSGLPVRDYYGEVSLEVKDAESLITWNVSFNPRIPGTGIFIQIAMRSTIAKIARALAAEAERRNGGH